MLAFHGSARCALNRDTFFPDSCVDVSCCLCVPDDSRTMGSTAGGRPGIGLADPSGFWNEGESTMVIIGDDPSPPPPPGGGAKDGESTIMGGN